MRRESAAAERAGGGCSQAEVVSRAQDGAGGSTLAGGLRTVAVAGMASGLAKTIISHPLDTVKVHVQNRMPPPTNPARLFRGISVPLMRNGVENSLHFLFRAVVASALSALSLHSAASNAFAVGFLSGFPQALFNTPADYVRLQLQLNQAVQLRSLFRGLPWVAAKEAASGAVFFGAYETIKRVAGSGWGAGIAGSLAALMAMVSTFPLDTLKTRVQAGGSLKSAVTSGKLAGGLTWAVAKCLAGNFVALSVFEAVRRWDCHQRFIGQARRSNNAGAMSVAICSSTRTRALAHPFLSVQRSVC
mmetsp:Transcript_2334/g.6307  ORF Transcript_2334/g.6307 Transcript_2334/m.6307 type:complete len:303 (+) Transcript_2334:69-977(+)